MDCEKIQQIIKILEEKKLKNIEAFDLKTKSKLLKFIILTTCANEKACKALSLEVQEELKEMGILAERQGEFPGDWVILDAKDLLIEFFTEDTRKRYNLEKLWGDSKNALIEAQKRRKIKKSKN